MKTKQIIFTAIAIVSLFSISSCSSNTCGNSKSEYQNGYALQRIYRKTWRKNLG